MNLPQNKKILTTTNAHIDNPTRVFPKNSVVFPKNGAAIATNKKRILAQDSVVDLNTGGLIANDSLLNYVFFYYIMQHIDFRLLIRRGAVPTLDISELKKVNIPIPSLDEQQQIVEELDLLSSIIEKKKEQLKELDNLAQSIFYDMFGDPVKNEKGWVIGKIEDGFSYIKNGVNIKQTKDSLGFPITRIETLSGGLFNRDRMGYANIFELGKYAQNVLDDGDILLSHINSKAFVGRAVMYSKMKDETIIHGMNLLRLVVKRERIEPRFAEFYFKTFFFKKEVEKLEKTL